MDRRLEEIYDSDRLKLLNRLSFKQRKKVRVMPVPQTGGWMPRNTEGDVLGKRSKVYFTAPYSTQRKAYIDPLSHLTEERKDELAVQLGLDNKHDLNPKKQKDNFWEDREVVLDGNGAIYVTDDPSNYVDLCILLANYEQVAASWASRKEKATYLFAVVDENEEKKEKYDKDKVKVEANEYFSDIKDSVDKLESVVWIRYWEKNGYQQPPAKPKHDWLFSEVYNMVDSAPKDFLDIVKDENFEIKALVKKGLNHGVLKRKNQKIAFSSADSPIGTFGETVEHLSSSQGQDDLLKLQDKVESKEGNG